MQLSCRLLRPVMAGAFYRQLPNHELVVDILYKLKEKSSQVGPCCLWNGPTDRDGYGVQRITVRAGCRLKFRVHRMSFFLLSPTFRPLDPKHHVSHLCHNKLCLKLDHLSYEPAHINNARKVCQSTGECTGHRGYARCRLNAVMFSECTV